MTMQPPPKALKPRFTVEKSYKNGDRLGGVEVLETLVNWGDFEPLLEGFTGYSLRDWKSGLVMPYDPILLCKIVVLESVFELNHEEVALSIRDRLSFIKFLDLGMGDRIPNTLEIVQFCEILEKEQKNGVQKVVKIIHDELGAQGLVLVVENSVTISVIYDPSSVEVDRVAVLKPEGVSALKQARSLERNELLKEADFKRTYSADIKPEGPVSGKDIALIIKDAMSAESQWSMEGRASRFNTAFLAMIGLVTLAVVCVFGYLVFRDNKGVVSLEEVQRLSREELERSKKSYKNLVITHKDLVRRFVETDIHEERLNYVRFPEKNSEAIRSFFELAEHSSDPIYDIDIVGMVSVKGDKHIDVKVTFESGNTRIASVVEGISGKFVDFASYARLNAVPWDSLLKEGGSSEESRATVSAVSYYNGEFEEEKYASYALNSPDLGEVTVYAYAERSSRMYRIMETLLRKAKKPRVVLSLSSVEDSYRLRQFSIDRVVSAGWAVSDEDLQRSVEKLEEHADLRERLEEE